MLRPAAALTIAVLLTGCSGPSVNLISADQISKFQVGKTNETEIVGALGKPIEIISEANGTKIDQYPYGGNGDEFGRNHAELPDRRLDARQLQYGKLQLRIERRAEGHRRRQIADPTPLHRLYWVRQLPSGWRQTVPWACCFLPSIMIELENGRQSRGAGAFAAGAA